MRNNPLLRLLAALLERCKGLDLSPKMQTMVSLLSLLLAVWPLAMQQARRPAAAPAPAPRHAPVKPAAPKSNNAREKFLATALAEVGTTEKTGRNDGPRIDAYLASCGLAGSGAPYCAAFVVWAGQTALSAKTPFPRSAWSPDLCSPATSLKGRVSAVRPGDLFGLYFKTKGRVAHVGIVRQMEDGWVRTVEANTSPAAGSGTAGDRDGDGVWSKLRPVESIYSFHSYFR